ncbi:MAG: septal ring lytic transglycosylase RlpA family protein, partial [Saprospiraceae bacterium]|nr:septal ring lytic transglycosylase RlpA family protein [Saprospiraceae bacterium]
MRQPLSLLILGLFVCLSMSSFAWQRSDEFGKAGYYADALQGRKTASGEKYDKKLLTCAHKSYPFGTKLRITRLDNKKAVIVRVNDRGPFTEGFVVDLSRAAAREIDLITAGRASVK